MVTKKVPAQSLPRSEQESCYKKLLYNCSIHRAKARVEMVAKYERALVSMQKLFGFTAADIARMNGEIRLSTYIDSDLLQQLKGSNPNTMH